MDLSDQERSQKVNSAIERTEQLSVTKTKLETTTRRGRDWRFKCHSDCLVRIHKPPL